MKLRTNSGLKNVSKAHRYKLAALHWIPDRYMIENRFDPGHRILDKDLLRSDIKEIIKNVPVILASSDSMPSTLLMEAQVIRFSESKGAYPSVLRTTFNKPLYSVEPELDSELLKRFVSYSGEDLLVFRPENHGDVNFYIERKKNST